MKKLKEIVINGAIFYQNEQGRLLVPETKNEFNQFIDVLFGLIENPTEEQLKNHNLIKEFPFLLPKNRWDKGLSFKSDFGFDFTWTEIDAMPRGWFLAFGMKMVKELKDLFVEKGENYIYRYMITDIKEKYGSLRWYDYGMFKGGYEIISKYTKLSRITCIICGEPATMISSGWINPYCEIHKLSGKPLAIVVDGEVIYDYYEDENEDE